MSFGNNSGQRGSCTCFANTQDRTAEGMSLRYGKEFDVFVLNDSQR